MEIALAFNYSNIKLEALNMGVFQWLLKKVTKAFGRGTNALFYTLLYREILKEINEVTKDSELSLKVLKQIGKKAAYESCERHSGIFKFMPGSPKKVIDYFAILWSVVFGMDIGEHTYEDVENTHNEYEEYLLHVKKCPICADYGNDPEDTFSFSQISKESEGMACGLCGMLESVANFILQIKAAEYRIGIDEIQCLAKKGGENLTFSCKVYTLNKWKEIHKDDVGEDFLLKKPGVLDKLQDAFSLDKLEELIDEPLEKIKDRLALIIKDNLNMEPEHFFDYFRNYEDDMIRILGFFAIHLLNEYGGLLEKFHQNETFAKISGYLFNHIKELSLLFIPMDVINDYHDLFVNFLEGLAPDEMVDNIRKFSGSDDIGFFFEGAQIALENLGINFSELKENIWAELRKEREDGLIAADQSILEKTQEKFPKLIQILQEILMLANEILTLPIRVMISESHHGLKTAINSIISEEEGLFGTIKDRADRIFDYVQELRE